MCWKKDGGIFDAVLFFWIPVPSQEVTGHVRLCVRLSAIDFAHVFLIRSWNCSNRATFKKTLLWIIAIYLFKIKKTDTIQSLYKVISKTFYSTHKNVDILCIRHVFAITCIKYAHNQKIGKPNNLKSKPKSLAITDNVVVICV